jgi:SAM-dependent methyltransferase
LKVFDAYSQYYDLLYRDKNYRSETEYIDKLIRAYAPQTKTILELGSGTGTHAMQLSHLGYNIHGIDQSPAMLEIANSKLQTSTRSLKGRVQFEMADIRNFNGKIIYDAAISLFHVMSYMQTQQDLLAAMQTAKKNIKQHGIFIFDCWHGPAVMEDKPISRTKLFENEGLHITRTSFPEHIPEKNSVTVNFSILVRNKITGETTKLKETHAMRYLFQEEIRELAFQSGFALLSEEEWMSGHPLSDKTWNACYILRRTD